MVGLLHHGALLYQMRARSGNGESEQYDPKTLEPTGDEKRFDMLNRMMFRPVMVATVDQLLSLAFNGNKRWAVVMGELMGGAIIFDEVHAYDGHMLALLERITRELRDSTPMLFMSATMPANLQDFLSRLLGVTKRTHIIKDEELINRKRNRFFDRTKEKVLDKKGRLQASIIKEIQSNLNGKRPRRIAIVCNTVKTAQTVYKQLGDELKDVLEGAHDRMCFHSRFIAKDRRDKEGRLEKDKTKSREEQTWPQVLVATQVIECGLDIDYDVLLTEAAPLEAIIQRAGRVNRQGDAAFGEVYCFQQDDDSQRWFYPPEITRKGLDILKKSIKKDPLVSEKQFMRMIEEVYADKRFEDDPRFLNTRRILDELMYDIGAIHDLPETDLHTRFVTYKMVEVVPETFWNEVRDRHQFEVMDYLVRMPLWAYIYNKAGDFEDWKVMDMEYDSEIGGKLKKDKDVFFA